MTQFKLPDIIQIVPVWNTNRAKSERDVKIGEFVEMSDDYVTCARLRKMEFNVYPPASFFQSCKWLRILNLPLVDWKKYNEILLGSKKSETPLLIAQFWHFKRGKLFIISNKGKKCSPHKLELKLFSHPSFRAAFLDTAAKWAAVNQESGWKVMESLDYFYSVWKAWWAIVVQLNSVLTWKVKGALKWKFVWFSAQV